MIRRSPRAPRTGAAAVLGAILAVAGIAPAFGQEIGQSSVRIDSIVVTGNSRHSAVDIINRSGLRVGNVVRAPQVASAINRLFASGDFSDVRMGVGGTDPTQGIFYIAVEERPYITGYVFEGLERVSEGLIRDTIGLARNSPLDPDRIARARNIMSDLLANEGFPTAEIDTLIRPDPVSLDDYVVTFDVREGPRLGIVEIDFVGNDSFTDAEIRSALVTDQEGFWWFNAGELKRDEFNRDVTQRLPAFYYSHGYLDFAVVRDTVISDPTTGKGRIEIEVSEGPQYVLEEFRISGNTAFPTAVIEPIARVGQDDVGDDGALPPFNRTAFDEQQGALADMYRNSGYLRVTFRPEIQRLPAPEEGGNPRVRALLPIVEGEPSYIREVSIEGNTYTHDRIVRNRLFIYPGDVYSQDRLIRSFQAIQGLGFFDPLPPEEAVQIRERPDGDIDVTLRVLEKQTGTLNFGVTASGYSGLAGFIGYTQPNLFGLAKTGSFRWIFGRRQQDLDLSYSDPEIFGSRYSGTISLRNSRDQFTGFSLGDRRQTGGLVEVGVPLLGLRSTRAFVGYSLFNDRVRGLDTTNVIASQANLFAGTRSAASLRIVQDTRNNPLFPTGGSRNSLSLRQTGGILGGDGNYQKIDLTSDWYVPVGTLGASPTNPTPIEFTFGLNFSAGVILGTNPFFTERYYAGGTQAGIPIRGYGEATVTPLGHLPDEAPISDLDRVGESFFKTGAVFGVKLTQQIFASAFVDAGNVWLTAADINPTDLLLGAGFGVSLVTPFGPIGLDYAYGFDRRDVIGRPNPGWQLHFKFGQIF
ncbi:MAG: outer membrane protein assembly factor BamA [Gemmatimonadota bacterium]|nr:outer membrane protein assembly factor BamA [Gemmatimonadota bacterium]